MLIGFSAAELGSAISPPRVKSPAGNVTWIDVGARGVAVRTGKQIGSARERPSAREHQPTGKVTGHGHEPGVTRLLDGNGRQPMPKSWGPEPLRYRIMTSSPGADSPLNAQSA